jgi:hypothetical protein
LVPKPDNTTWKIDDFHDAEIRERFGFDSVAHLHRLHTALGWPDQLLAGTGAAPKQYYVDGEQALLFMLERDHCATKYSIMEFVYGTSYNSICEQTLAAERWLVDTHRHRLEDLAFFQTRFALYAERIRHKIESRYDDVPPEADKLIGFLDRVSMRIAKPSGNWAFQRLFYSVKSAYHCLAYQGVCAPDGMIIHFWGPAAGKHNDRLLLTESNFNGLLENLQLLPNGELPDQEDLFGVYTDRGYDNNTCVRAARHGPLVDAEDVMFNNILSAVRIAVEWSFATLRAMSKLLHSSWNMRLQAEAVDLHVKAAVLLGNARTTLQRAHHPSKPATTNSRSASRYTLCIFGNRCFPITTFPETFSGT